MDGSSEFLTVSEAAEALGLSESAVRTRLRLAQMAGVRKGLRLWLITRTEVERQRGLGRQRTGPKPRKQDDRAK